MSTAVEAASRNGFFPGFVSTKLHGGALMASQLSQAGLCRAGGRSTPTLTSLLVNLEILQRLRGFFEAWRCFWRWQTQQTRRWSTWTSVFWLQQECCSQRDERMQNSSTAVWFRGQMGEITEDMFDITLPHANNSCCYCWVEACFSPCTASELFLMLLCVVAQWCFFESKLNALFFFFLEKRLNWPKHSRVFWWCSEGVSSMWAKRICLIGLIKRKINPKFDQLWRPHPSGVADGGEEAQKGGVDACDAQASVRAQSACFSGVKPQTSPGSWLKSLGAPPGAQTLACERWWGQRQNKTVF